MGRQALEYGGLDGLPASPREIAYPKNNDVLCGLNFRTLSSINCEVLLNLIGMNNEIPRGAGHRKSGKIRG